MINEQVFAIRKNGKRGRKVSETMKGHLVSEETKRKMSEAARKCWRNRQ